MNPEISQIALELVVSGVGENIDDERFNAFKKAAREQIAEMLRKRNPELLGTALEEAIELYMKSVCYWQAATDGYSGA